MYAAGLDYRTLARIAATLCALAVLAERVASRSLPVRWLVLCILRRAEAVAHAFVVEVTQANWPCFDEPLDMQNRPVDAAWLAWRFCVLAAALGALQRLASRPDRWGGGLHWAILRLPPRPVLVTCVGSIRAPNDTS